MALPYQRPDISIGKGQPNAPSDVRALQHDLRVLGYLQSGIDGAFGAGTDRAIRALQYDLLNNDGQGSDGRAPVPLTSFNMGSAGARVKEVTGILDAALADAIADILSHPSVGKLPSAEDPVVENNKALNAIGSTSNSKAPAP